MKRAARIIFNGAALVSLLMLVFLAWLRWIDHEPLGHGRYAVLMWGPEVVIFIAGGTSESYPMGATMRVLHFHHGFALSLASILPASWLVLSVTRRRRSAGRGFAVEPAKVSAPRVS
jgi:hypothetical protein